MDIKKFSIGGWYSNFFFLKDFLTFYLEQPEYFREDRIIDSIYDAYSQNEVPLVWNGGRVPVLRDPHLSMDTVLNFFSQYPFIKLRHTFTNCLLDDPALLTDYRCNTFVKNYIRPQDEIIVNHPNLINYLKENYPNIPLIYSTSIGITNIDTINEITKTNLLVLDYSKNNNNEFIEHLKNKNNIEILCGETCWPNCIHRQDHYRLVSQNILNAQLDINKLYNEGCLGSNKAYGQNLMDYMLSFDYSITNERVDELFNKYNIQNFKISTRSKSIPFSLQLVLYYLAKPEYYTYLFDTFLNEWW